MTAKIVNDSASLWLMVVTLRTGWTLIRPLDLGDLVPSQCFLVVLLVYCVCQSELVSEGQRYIDLARSDDIVQAQSTPS